MYTSKAKSTKMGSFAQDNLSNCEKTAKSMDLKFCNIIHNTDFL